MKFSIFLRGTTLIGTMAILASLRCHAGVIAAWDLNGQPGNQIELAATASVTGIDTASITRGASLNATSGSHSFSSSGWSGNEADDYLSFVLGITEGYQLDLSSLEITTRASNTGPGTLGLFSSRDGFSSPLGMISQIGSNVLSSSIDLSGLGNLLGGVEFRLLELGNTQADGSGDTTGSGTFRLLNNGSDFTRFEGSIAIAQVQDSGAVPLPATFWLFGAALTVLGVQRWHTKKA